MYSQLAQKPHIYIQSNLKLKLSFDQATELLTDLRLFNFNTVPRIVLSEREKEKINNDRL